MPPYLLALDNGTQSVRALLFDAEGNLVAKAQIALDPPYFQPSPGYAERDPISFWEAACAACQSLWHNHHINPADIAGMSVTTQRGTVIHVNAEGNALRPAILWLDQRHTAGLAPVRGLWGLIFRLIGMRETIAYLQAEAEVNWVRTHQAEIAAKTHKVLLLSGYLTHQLTGNFVDSVGAQVGYLPFDYRALRWASPSSWHWQSALVTPAQLPNLLPPASLLGQVSARAAAQTGLPVGLPVFAGAGDKACEVLGAGCLTPEVGCIGYGTTATLNTFQTRYIEAVPFIPPYPAAVPNAYNLEYQIYRGYWLVSWFKAQFGGPELAQAAQQGIAVETLFDALAAQAPAGALGLTLQPYWTPGIKLPGREGKGAIIGFGDVHGRAHFYRAILEGVAYALRQGKERLEARSRTKITSLRVCGGGSQSDQVLQITADIFNLPASRPHLYEASGLGAAIDAAVGLGLYSDFASAVAAMTRPAERVFMPNPQNSALYESLYQRVYKPLYGRLRPLYKAIQEITGYP
jgi:sugar (pentulose or hexulose) kinase